LARLHFWARSAFFWGGDSTSKLADFHANKYDLNNYKNRHLTFFKNTYIVKACASMLFIMGVLNQITLCQQRKKQSSTAAQQLIPLHHV
jgi:hypothetical protein